MNVDEKKEEEEVISGSKQVERNLNINLSVIDWIPPELKATAGKGPALRSDLVPTQNSYRSRYTPMQLSLLRIRPKHEFLTQKNI